MNPPLPPEISTINSIIYQDNIVFCANAENYLYTLESPDDSVGLLKLLYGLEIHAARHLIFASWPSSKATLVSHFALFLYLATQCNCGYLCYKCRETFHIGLSFCLAAWAGPRS